MEGRTNMDENVAKFSEKMKELLALAKKKKNVLEYQEISDFFSDMELDAEQFDKILEFLEHNNVDVLRITDDDDDSNIILSDEDEVDEYINPYVPIRSGIIHTYLLINIILKHL